MNPGLDYALPLTTPCKEWTGTHSRGSDLVRGYGVTSANGKTVLVHRKTWEDARGPIPPGMMVCHKCDNPPCYELDHLFIGTNVDNIADATRKHRYSGERKAIAKLKNGSVIAIRHLLTVGIDVQVLADAFKVHNSTIYRIGQHKIWTHI